MSDTAPPAVFTGDVDTGFIDPGPALPIFVSSGRLLYSVKPDGIELSAGVSCEEALFATAQQLHALALARTEPAVRPAVRPEGFGFGWGLCFLLGVALIFLFGYVVSLLEDGT